MGIFNYAILTARLGSMPGAVRYAFMCGVAFLYGNLIAGVIWFGYGFYPLYQIICGVAFALSCPQSILVVSKEGWSRAFLLSAALLSVGVIFWFEIGTLERLMLARGLTRGALAAWVDKP